MKNIVVKREELVKAIGTVSKAINNKSINNIPALAGVYFVAKGGTMTLTSSNTTTSISTKIPLESGEDDTFLVDAAILKKALTDITEETITITREEAQVTFAFGKSDFTLTSLDTTFYPDQFKDLESKTMYTLPTVAMNDLMEGVLGALACVAQDEKRPVMTCVLADFSNNTVNFVGSDGVILSSFEAQTTGGNVTNVKLLLSQEIAGMMTSGVLLGEEAFTIRYNDKMYKIETPTTSISTLALEWNYPNYKAILSGVKADKTVTINRKELLTAIKRISLFSTEKSWLGILDFTEGSVTISASDSGKTRSAKEVLATQGYAGEDSRKAFNTERLSTLLKTMTSDEVTMCLNDDPLKFNTILEKGVDLSSNRVKIIIPMKIS
nr:MAG TPA: beta clamp protein [Caudoviricetes sp.]